MGSTNDVIDVIGMTAGVCVLQLEQIILEFCFDF
jgi:hypothetical protein